MTEVKYTLLLVDKDPVDLDTLARRLRRRGFDVITQSTNDETLRALAFEKIDLIIIDYSTPEQDGMQLLRRLRGQPRSARLPVILMVPATEKGEAAGVLAALDQGANDYVSKPVDIDVLMASIRTFLPNSNMLASLSGTHSPVKVVPDPVSAPMMKPPAPAPRPQARPPFVSVRPQASGQHPATRASNPLASPSANTQPAPSSLARPAQVSNPLAGPAGGGLPARSPSSVAARESLPPGPLNSSPGMPAVGPRGDNSMEHAALGEASQSADSLGAQDVLVGTVLDGKYRLDARIDSGGFGSVYRGTHLGLRRPVAIKILHFHLLDSQQIVRRFRREAISGGQIKHPNAVAILDAGATPSGTPFLVMEYLEGITLETELRTRGVMRFVRVAAIIGQVCDFLVHAHAAGVIHRDIKPANIHLSRNKTGERVKVLDFGLAKLQDVGLDSYVSSDETVIGTPQFMAPERLLGRPVDGRADVYSLGATAYLMLTGSLPFDESDESLLSRAVKQINTPPTFIQRLRPDLPDDLAMLVMRMLARSRRARPSLLDIKQQTAEWAVRWQETWPPTINRGPASPLELGDTRKLPETPSSAAMSSDGEKKV
jgi:serine/threonine protein kinase/CheY-like chemotaxis protein